MRLFKRELRVTFFVRAGGEAKADVVTSELVDVMQERINDGFQNGTETTMMYQFDDNPKELVEKEG